MGFKTKDKQEALQGLEKLLSLKARYLGPPTFSYRVGDYTIDRNGYVDGPSDVILEAVKNMIIEVPDRDSEHIKMDVLPAEVTVASVRNLINMIHSKQYLIGCALCYKAFYVPRTLVTSINGKDTTMKDVIDAIKAFRPIGIETADGGIKITGFPAGDAFETLSKAMIDYARGRHYILPDETIPDNEKYYMRAWLVRIGLGGKEYKMLRQIMLKNLQGHTAFRTDSDAEKWKERYCHRMPK